MRKVQVSKEQWKDILGRGNRMRDGAEVGRSFDRLRKKGGSQWGYAL